MSQPESHLSRKIMTELRAMGVFCFKVHGSEHMMAGLPDIIACVGGFFIGYEVKIPGKAKNLSARQEYVHELIRQAKGIACVVTSVQEAVAVTKLVQAVATAVQQRAASTIPDEDDYVRD